MRVLHTSDWHVGRTFHGRDLLADQESVLGGLADLVRAEGVDVVVVAGDLYDRAVPSAESVEICARVLTRIREAGARIVITPGNHDSAQRIGVFGEFAAAGGLHLLTRISGLASPVLIDGVAFYGLPYLDPEPARHSLGITAGRGHAVVLAEAMRRVRADIEQRPGTRSVVLAHAFVVGGQTSDSERSIRVGGVEHVPASVFDGVDYVALGHLHGPQVLAEHLRYSGSPIAYSFSEAQHRKSVWLVDLDDSGLRQVRRHELPVPRRLATITGRLHEVLADPAHTELEDCFLSVTVTDEVRPLDLQRRLQQRFPHAVHADWRPEGGRARGEMRYAEAVRGRTDQQIAAGFVADCRGSTPTGSEQALLDKAFQEVGRE
ncbi:exonuclease SbcCD subunit D [Kutzneria viridogrisea]|uniref:Nuclease SbcCD subunit D n=1 Tax=Kutzneria viridogrisea TaxID=47990 RepID=A0ABR6BTF0_9PSEU|nr:exonuclease SbcD [Kutzneria viridogrisea]